MDGITYCSPKRHKNFQKHGTCFTHTELKQIANQYNQSHPKTKISIRSSRSIIDGLKKSIKQCNGLDEYCWIEQPFVGDLQDNLQSNFRPVKPISWESNNEEWLNTFDILHVMKQYEYKFKEFKFLGVFPIDFAKPIGLNACVSQAMCKFDVSNLKETIIGVVFNTDTSDRPGKHWISSYMVIDPTHPQFGMYFFDSFGKTPPLEVTQLFDSIKSKVKNINVLVNKKRYQYKNSECGMYSMLFIILMLENQSMKFKNIQSLIGKDDVVNRLRNVLYRPSSLYS